MLRSAARAVNINIRTIGEGLGQPTTPYKHSLGSVKPQRAFNIVAWLCTGYRLIFDVNAAQILFAAKSRYAVPCVDQSGCVMCTQLRRNIKFLCGEAEMAGVASIALS